MEFQRLRLAGFKSFAEAVDIALLPGLTGIVGPNGCGKSNLTEAMRWAMGEGRAGGMRADSMDEVIFAGARGRPGRNLAEVAIGLLNAGEQIEIVRRIARGEGSTYLLNGREARQRDVQLLFADAATGAHAAALVGQGRVAAVIAAKPTERRAMLEEAAGIAGLAVRRKEAESRLRAASANLARVEDLGRELEAQVASLKRQARAAERYADLSNRIRAAEARLLFAGWRAADARARTATARASEAEAAVETARTIIAVAEAARAEAAQTAFGARDAEGAARVATDRAERMLAGLAEERARADRRRGEIDSQIEALGRDEARETVLATEGQSALAHIAAAIRALRDEEGARAAENAAAHAAASEAEAQLPLAETALAEALDSRARAIADRRVAEEAVRTTAAALARAEGELAALDRERSALATSALRSPPPEEEEKRPRPPPGTQGERAAAETARAALAAAAAETDFASAALEAARAGLDAARADLDAAQARAGEHAAPLAAARAQVAGLAAEAAALAPRSASGAGGSALTVTPGWEAALAAALGDDLAAAVGRPGEGWARLAPADSDPPLPPGCTPIAASVQAPPELARRLAQIGLVPDRPTGDALAPVLAPGQRLVSGDGALWRWDGFEQRSASNTAAAQRLRAVNRSVDLAALLATAHATLIAREAEGGAATAAQRAAAETVRAAEARRAAAAQALSAAQARRAAADRARGAAEARAARAEAETHARAERARTDGEARAAAAGEAEARRVARLSALEAAHVRLAQERGSAADAVAAAQTALAAAPPLATTESAATAARAAAEAARAAQSHSAARTAAAARAIEEAARALTAAADDAAQWRTRAQAAEARLADLAPRATVLAAARAAAADPGTVREAEARAALATAQAALATATAARVGAEARATAAEVTLAEANEARAVHREARAAAAAEADHAAQAREDLRRAALDRHACEPAQLPTRFDFEPDDAPVSRREAELDQLARDRDRLGPVNLRALHELEEAAARATSLAAERQEVETAIARLRGSIGALNRDGRTRLLATFEGVDRRFRTLFATLFDGGEARLALMDSEDPLDAGLEIYAKPPGKAAQSLALLSGGEQALTAVALLFAFFLENPSPICVLDEVDAPLDDANVERFCDLLREVAGGTATRFLVVTHNPVTMAAMDRLYGVTMAEPGVSQLVSVDLAAAEALLAAG